MEEVFHTFVFFKRKLGSFLLGYKVSIYAVYVPLDQGKIHPSNSIPRFRWELGNLDPSLEFFDVYTPS
jgi:hypothetical protein